MTDQYTEYIENAFCAKRMRQPVSFFTRANISRFFVSRASSTIYDGDGASRQTWGMSDGAASNPTTQVLFFSFMPFPFNRVKSGELRVKIILHPYPHSSLSTLHSTLYHSTSFGAKFSCHGRPHLFSASMNGSGSNSSILNTPGPFQVPFITSIAPIIAGTPVV